jgi:hypothetical protein
MPHVRLVTINGSAGAFTPILAATVSRRVEIVEDASANAGVAQGLQYQIDDGTATPFVQIYEVLPSATSPSAEPIVLGEFIPQGGGYGRTIGTPADNSGGYSIPATLLANVRSYSATATTVRVTEHT